MQVKVKVLDEYKNLEVPVWGDVPLNARGVVSYKRISLIPKRSSDEAAGWDIFCAKHVTIPAFRHVHASCSECSGALEHLPGKATINTGIAIEIPSGWEAQVRPRSGLSTKNLLCIPNSPGTIDSDYRGEVLVTMLNHGGKPHEFFPGDRIAQLIFKEVPAVSMLEVDALSETRRGTGGFGSTGL